MSKNKMKQILYSGIIVIIISLLLFKTSISIKAYFISNYSCSNATGINVVEGSGRVVSDLYYIKEADVEVIAVDEDGNKIITFKEKYYGTSILTFKYSLQERPYELKFQLSNIKANNGGHILISVVLFSCGVSLLIYYFKMNKR